MVKKEGPCRHCGILSSPLWRNGPPEKPVLCNACGTRWKKRGTLENYTPAHRPQDAEAEGKQPKKRRIRKIVKKEPCSDQDLWKTGDAADTSNPSGFGSALSYSGSAQSHAPESLAPSRKKSCVGRRKRSTVEVLAEDLNSIMHEEQLRSGSGVRTIPGSSEEDLLLYHSKTSAGSFEIGYGSMLLTHESARRDKLDYSKQRILENVDSALVSVPLAENYSKEVGGRGNAGGAFRGLTNSTMRSLKRPHGSQLQNFTDAEVRGGTKEKAASRSGAMASCQLRMLKSGNATGGAAAALNLFMLPPGKLSSMPAPPDKDCDQDSLLLEIPHNARHPDAELLRCWPPPSQLSSVPLTAALPPSYQSQFR